MTIWTSIGTDPQYLAWCFWGAIACGVLMVAGVSWLLLRQDPRVSRRLRS